jgi:hypothetical protein
MWNDGLCNCDSSNIDIINSVLKKSINRGLKRRPELIHEILYVIIVKVQLFTQSDTSTSNRDTLSLITRNPYSYRNATIGSTLVAR